MINVYVVAEEIGPLYAARNYLKQKADWRVAWGLVTEIPPDVQVVLIGAESFVNVHAEGKKILHNKISVVHGHPCYLEASFMLGCDDYVKLPWSVEEVYRRIAKFDMRLKYFTVGGVKIEVHANHIACNSMHIHITATESDILKTLIASKNRPIATQVLNYAVTKGIGYMQNNQIRVHIYHIRKKLDMLPCVRFAKEIIVTLPKERYLLQSG